jgi:hypothetical protein
MKKSTFAYFLGVMMLLAACSSNATVPAPATAVPTETSIPTVVPSPTETPVPTITPVPTVTLTPAPTATLDPRPTFPESGTMRSEHLTVALSQKWMDAANIAKITLDSAVMEDIRRVMLVHWAWRLSQYSKDPRLNVFKNADGTELPVELTSSERLKRALIAYEQNAQLSDKGFQYEFDLGEGVKGKMVDIDIRALAAQEEWAAVISMSEKMGYVTRIAKSYGTDEKAIIYFDANGIFHAYLWAGNPYKTLPYLSTKGLTYQLLRDLFAVPAVQVEFVIGLTVARGQEGTYGSPALWEAIGCGVGRCYSNGGTNAYFDITLNDGTRLAPSKK